MTPRHTHDCERCTFLGCYGESDLYHCASSMAGPTVIARFGPEGDYASAMTWAPSTRPIPQPLPSSDGYNEHMAALRVALLLAIDAGLPIDARPPA